MEDFKDSKYDHSGWNLRKWVEEAKKKEVVANKNFTEDTKCLFVGGRYNGKVMTVAELRKLEKELGKHKDFSDWRSCGIVSCPYRIFDNAPTVSGYLGPMWGTCECPFRYETKEVYEQLSK